MAGPPSIGHETYGGAVLLTVLCAGVGELLAWLIGMPTSTGLWLGGLVGAAISWQQIQKEKRAVYERWEEKVRRDERGRRERPPFSPPIRETVPIGSEIVLAPAADTKAEAEARTVGVVELSALLAQLKRLQEIGGVRFDATLSLVTVDPSRSLLFVAPGEGASFETLELRVQAAGPGATWLTTLADLNRRLFAVGGVHAGVHVALGETEDGSMAIAAVEANAIETLLASVNDQPAAG